MGYGQLWEIKGRRRWLSVWPRLVADTRIIVDAADIDLTSDRIWDMDEVQSEYGGSDEGIRRLLEPPPPIVDEEKGIVFNGIQNELPEKADRDTLDDGWEWAFSLIALLWPEDEIPEESEGEYNSDTEETGLMELERPLVKNVEPKSEKWLESSDANDTLQRSLLPLEFSDSLVSTVLEWVHHCDNADSGHETCHSIPHQRQRHLPFMRLIDVEKECIVSSPLNPLYIALSYVWGNLNQSRLLSSNLSQLLEDGGMRKLGCIVSKTIADSMAMCQRLGYRYLWVDALCIMQDNYQDKILQLNTMRDIYSNAALTIAAANGNHANSGLDLAGREISSTMVERPDVWEIFLQAISNTVWETRGWTFQEKILSRRLLLFSPAGPFFVCGAQIYSEHGFQKLGHNSIHCDRPGSFFNIKPGNQLESYLTAVQRYSKRKLTMEADFESALKGITKTFGSAMDGRPNSFFRGIPTSFFDEIFCWRVAEHDPEARRWQFPSWSWQGWKQTPTFPKTIMDKINWKHKENLWSSRILAYDRGNDFDSRTKLDSFGVNTAGTENPLLLSWKGAPLEILMECSEDIGSNNGLFRVFSPVNGHYAGMIQLHKEWRATQPATLEFLPVFTEMSDGEARIKVMMCLEHSDRPSRAMASPKWSFERVQLMDCDIREKDWMAMREGSPTTRGRETGWIY